LTEDWRQGGFGLYIHWPFCEAKCPYCDFNSHQAGDEIPEQAYIDALIRDLEQDLPLVWGRTIQTIFIGGGTPSLFSAEAYDRLFSALRALLPIRTDAEITLEANPGTFEAARFTDYRAIGINRLSIGIQSFDGDSLTALGRIHDGRQAIRAAEIAHQAGFDNFNLDLMFGLPGQTAELARKDVETAIALEPTHISYYQLTIEPNTFFHQSPPQLPDDEPIDNWQIANQHRLAEAGYLQYEVSAYAKNGRQSRHNLNYWQFGDYLGIGAGAHSKLTSAATQSIERLVKQKQPQAYLDKVNNPQRVMKQEPVGINEIGFEFMLNALRLTDGFATSLFMQQCGVPLATIKKPLAEAEERGLIDYSVKWIRPTELGQRYLNSLIELFLPQ